MTCASSWLIRVSRVAITASLATISARSRATVATAAGSGAPAAGSSGTPTLTVFPPSWSAVPAHGRRGLAPPQPAGQGGHLSAQRAFSQDNDHLRSCGSGRRPPTMWLLHPLHGPSSSPVIVGSQRPAVGRRPTKQRAQALRRVELEHPAVPLHPDIEGAKATQGHALAAFQRRIDLLQEPIHDLGDRLAVPVQPPRHPGHQFWLVDSLSHPSSRAPSGRGLLAQPPRPRPAMPR